MRVILFLLTIILCISITGCQGQESNNEKVEKTATVAKVAGSEYDHVILSQLGADRIGIALVPAGKQIPYSAILYGIHGETWVYVLLKPLTFTRTKVVIDHIDHDTAVLTAGPPINSQIVSQGATELYGVEYIGNIEP